MYIIKIFKGNINNIYLFIIFYYIDIIMITTIIIQMTNFKN